MLSHNSDKTVLISAAAGLVSHWGYFIHGEHHMSAPLLGRLFLVLGAMLYIFELRLYQATYSQALKESSIIIAAYLIPLFTSMIIYRTCFHRLNGFRGPKLARVSKLWHSWQARHSKNHLLLEKLNREYGNFVRTGPEEVTIFSAEAIFAFDGPGSPCRKTDWYDNILPLKSLVNIRDRDEHDQRRKIWDQALNSKALRDFESRILKHGEQLDRRLSLADGKGIDCNDWFHFYSFDVLGDLAFGRSFNMLVEEKYHHAVVMMRLFMSFQGPFSPVPWLCRLGFGLPGLANGWKQFINYCKAQMAERISTEVPVPDISSRLIKASAENDSLENDREYLDGDSVAMIIAGSDTTASTLTFVFYHLARYPEYQTLLREELDTITSITDFQAIQNLPILKSIITESLRLFPPVPTAGARLSPPEGITVEGTYIPPGVAVFTPRYNIARLESCFERAYEFIPERWTSKPEMVRDKRGWSPFSQGRYGCVGKGLAMKNVSYVTALLVSRYIIEPAPGIDITQVWRDLRDDFTAVPGRLDLVFKPRKA